MRTNRNFNIPRWFHSVFLAGSVNKDKFSGPFTDEEQYLVPLMRDDNGSFTINRPNGTSVTVPDFDKDYPTRLVIATEFKKMGIGDPVLNMLVDLPEPDRKEAFRVKYEEQVALIFGLPPGSRLFVAPQTSGIPAHPNTCITVQDVTLRLRPSNRTLLDAAL